MLRPSAVTALFVAGSRVCAFLAVLAAIDHYGSEEFGAISVAQQVALFAVVVAGVGLDLHAVRFVVRAPEKMGTVATSVMLGRLSTGVVGYLLLLLLATVVPPLREIRTMVAIAGLSLFTQAVTVLWVPQAVQRPSVHGLTHLGTQALFLGFVHLAIHRDLGSWSVPAALVVAQGIGAVALLVWSRVAVGPLGPPLPHNTMRNFVHTALPFGGSNILRSLATNSDIILLGLIVGGKTAAVGWYGGATRLYLFGQGILSVYFVVLFPVLVERAARGARALRQELRRSLVRTTLPAVLAGIASVWLARDVLVLLYPEDFAGATFSLRCLTGAMLASILAGQFRHALLAMNRQVVDMHNMAWAAVVHVPVKAALVVGWGIDGAALGTLAGEVVFLLFSAVTCARALGRMPAEVAPD